MVHGDSVQVTIANTTSETTIATPSTVWSNYDLKICQNTACHLCKIVIQPFIFCVSWSCSAANTRLTYPIPFLYKWIYKHELYFPDILILVKNICWNEKTSSDFFSNKRSIKKLQILLFHEFLSIFQLKCRIFGNFKPCLKSVVRFEKKQLFIFTYTYRTWKILFSKSIQFLNAPFQATCGAY